MESQALLAVDFFGEALELLSKGHNLQSIAISLSGSQPVQILPTFWGIFLPRHHGLRKSFSKIKGVKQLKCTFGVRRIQLCDEWFQGIKQLYCTFYVEAIGLGEFDKWIRGLRHINNKFAEREI